MKYLLFEILDILWSGVKTIISCFVGGAGLILFVAIVVGTAPVLIHFGMHWILAISIHLLILIFLAGACRD